MLKQGHFQQAGREQSTRISYKPKNPDRWAKRK